MTDLAEQLVALAADPNANEQAQAIAEQTVAALVSTLGPELIGRGPEAVALQRQAFAKLRAADSHEQCAQLGVRLAEVEQARQAAEHEVDVLAEAERVALGAVRHAEDRHRESIEHARECADAAVNAEQIGDTPAVQVETLLARDAAQVVVDRFAAKVTEAQHGHEQAAARVVAARELVKALRGAEQTARDLLDQAQAHPERAPRSTETLLLSMVDSVREYAELTDADRTALRGLLAGLAETIGADRPGRAESRAAGYEQGLAAGRDEARRNSPGGLGQGGQHVTPPGVGRGR